MQDTEGAADSIRLVDLAIDWQARRVTREGTEVPLSDLNFQVFRLIADAYPNVASPDSLKEAWPSAAASDETIAKRVTLLRKALGDSGRKPRYIETVRGSGYRLKAVPVYGDGLARELPQRSRVLIPAAIVRQRWALIVPLVLMGLLSYTLWWELLNESVTRGYPERLIEFKISPTATNITARHLPPAMGEKNSLSEIEDEGGFRLIVPVSGLPQSAGRLLDFEASRLEKVGTPEALQSAQLLRDALQRIHFERYRLLETPEG